MQVVEDIERGWARTFDVTATPSLFLINARREFVWKATGDLYPADIAAALDQHVVPTLPPRFVPYRLRVSVGDRMPDVQFKDDRGDEGALRRLRGRSGLITFCQSWSSPCLAELGRLQAVLNADPQGAPSIVAFHGGPDHRGLDGIRKELGLAFPIVQDTEHRAARIIGVRCWPTTITIDPIGLVEHIQFGFRHDRTSAGSRSSTVSGLRIDRLVAAIVAVVAAGLLWRAL
jgi:peroxiredoxin